MNKITLKMSINAENVMETIRQCILTELCRLTRVLKPLTK